MEKKLLKAYQSPATTVVNLESSRVICTSGTTVDDPWNTNTEEEW